MAAAAPAHNPERIRNVAIIAHVDHGKTTLVDQLLRQSGLISNQIDSGNDKGELVMDSNDLERERGITILAKATQVVTASGLTLNIVDTPGHADFAGEVERILSIVDGVVLLVDAAEGPRPQTKYVLRKALARGLRPILVLNKMDKPDARSVEVEGEVFDLCTSLGATDEQLDYPTLYASARQGWVSASRTEKAADCSALVRTIEQRVPPPLHSLASEAEHPDAMRLLVTSLDHDDFLGQILIGRVFSGAVNVGDMLAVMRPDGKQVGSGRVLKLVVRRGMERVFVESAGAGDLVGSCGLPDAQASDSGWAPQVEKPLRAPVIDPPVLRMMFAVNSSPLAGQSGTRLTSNMIRDRLVRETKSNVAIQIQPRGEATEVFGRGELQLSVLIETMRREGFELAIEPPTVVYRRTADFKVLEPYEEVMIDVADEHVGGVITMLTQRGAHLEEVKASPGEAGRSQMSFVAASRALLGLRNEVLTETRGTALMSYSFKCYGPHAGTIERTRRGAIISTATGKATAYSLEGAEQRGMLFVGPGEEVYEGMVIGESAKSEDVTINPTKAKHLTNVRAAGKDEAVRLTPPRRLTLESGLASVRDDELIEVTPSAIRLRKRVLNDSVRRSSRKRAADSDAGDVKELELVDPALLRA